MKETPFLFYVAPLIRTDGVQLLLALLIRTDTLAELSVFVQFCTWFKNCEPIPSNSTVLIHYDEKLAADFILGGTHTRKNMQLARCSQELRCVRDFGCHCQLVTFSVTISAWVTNALMLLMLLVVLALKV